MTDVSNGADIIDSRDVDERIAELEELDEDKLDDEELDELNALRKLRDEEGNAEWQYGQVFIRDSHFADYAQSYAEDIGAIQPDAPWPASCIDWDKAANELQQDYTSADYDGVTYWTR